MGIAPVKIAPVNDPKTAAVCGAKVVISAPHASGATIIPPGIFSIDRLILIAVSPPHSRDCVGIVASVEVYQRA
jgi:hypothetical protein